MRGARSHLGGGTAPSVCLAGRKMEWRYKPAKTLFTLHPFPCWISLLPLSKPDRPETLETTVSSRCVPFLVFSEGLEGLLEMWNKLVCPWRVTLRGILPFFNYYGTPFYLQEALFKGGGASGWAGTVQELSLSLVKLICPFLVWSIIIRAERQQTHPLSQSPKKQHLRGRKYCTYSTWITTRTNDSKWSSVNSIHWKKYDILFFLCYSSLVHIH